MPRPIGRKNNATLLKEAEKAKALKLCEGHAMLEAPAIVLAMAEKAKNGDVSAAKLILDRVYPAMRQVEDRPDANRQIVINITGDASIAQPVGEKNGQYSTESDAVVGESVATDGEGAAPAHNGKGVHHHQLTEG